MADTTGGTLREIFLLGLALVWAQAAAAGPILRNEIDSDDMAWFYNRPGVTLAQLAEDTEACRFFGRAMLGDASGQAFATYGLVGALIVDANSAAPVRAAMDDCMIARGYRRFTTADRNQRTFLQRYEAMSEEARLALAASEAPQEGVLSRRWGNDYWSVDETRDVPRPPIELRPRNTVPTMEIIDEVDLSSAIALAPDQALLILSIQPGSAQTPRGGVVEFSRDDRATGFPDLLSTRPQGRRVRWPVIRAVSRGRELPDEPREFAFVVPAGYYSLSGTWAADGVQVQFCMGTPAFNVEPGAVLHLGNFVMERGSDRVQPFFGAPGVGVRLEAVDLAGPRSRLMASPELAARIAHAEYHNGFVRACVLTIWPYYGFDLPGAQWIDAQASSAKAQP